MTIQLTPAQLKVVDGPTRQGERFFVYGPAGSGKTTTLQRRLVALLAAGVPSYTILVLLAEPADPQAFRSTVAQAGLGPYADLCVTTFVQLARELVNLFWPLVARPAGFDSPHRPPTFLSYDLAQLQMSHVIEPMVAAGAFDGLTLRRQQILSQLLDNLNRAALNMLSLDEMETRLVATWSGDPDHKRFLSQASEAARRFRRSCLASNLVDLSLLVEAFRTQLLDHPLLARYLTERYQHVIADNTEELPPVGIRFLKTLLPERRSAALAFDQGGGYRRYMAADPDGAWVLQEACTQSVQIEPGLTSSPPLTALGRTVGQNLAAPTVAPAPRAQEALLSVIRSRYRHEMIHQVAAELQQRWLPEVGKASRIALLTPYLDSTLLYSLTSQLAAVGVPFSVLRRGRRPRDEPLVQAWLALAALAYPGWRLTPAPFDIARALEMAIARLDWPRAVLLARELYQADGPRLLGFDALSQVARDRIGEDSLALVDEMRLWLEEWSGKEPLDRFLRQLFADLLSKRRFQPVPDLHAAAVCEWLARAAGRFAIAAPAMGIPEPASQGQTFVESILNGVVTGATMPSCRGGDQSDPDQAVTVSTLYAYLLSGHPVDIQVWLEAGATGWWEIPRQPLSNAFVMTPGWDPSQLWTELDGSQMRNQLLAHLVRGLCARCSRGVVLATSELDRRGQRQDGPLWRALLPLLDKGMAVW